MNTFVLAIVAFGLVGFLILRRRRRAAAGSVPADRRPSRPSFRRRRGSEPAPVAPAAAMAETAASRPPPPAFEAPPLERIAPPIPDWTPHDEMIVEPGWPLPGEIAGSWTTGSGSAASPVAVEEPPPSALEPDAEPDADDLADEWTMPTIAYAEAPAGPEPEFPAEPGVPAEPEGIDADMEAWVPGVSEFEPIAFAEPEPEPEPELKLEPEPVSELASPAGPWAEAEGEITTAEAASLWVAEPVAQPVAEDQDEDEPAEDPAGPPLWTPDDIPAPDGPADSAAVAFEDAPVITLTLDEPVWEPASPTAEPVPVLDLAEQSRELADLLPQAVSGLRPLLGVSDALGVTPRMLVVLHTLAERPLSLPEQARALGVSRPVVADICARLEQLGFARRERDERDRRRVRVMPTPKGLRLAGQTSPRIDADGVAGALELLSPAERTALVSAARALTESPRRPA